MSQYFGKKVDLAKKLGVAERTAGRLFDKHKLKSRIVVTEGGSFLLDDAVLLINAGRNKNRVEAQTVKPKAEKPRSVNNPRIVRQVIYQQQSVFEQAAKAALKNAVDLGFEKNDLAVALESMQLFLQSIYNELDNKYPAQLLDHDFEMPPFLTGDNIADKLTELENGSR